MWLAQGGASWTVVLPLKNLARAKSRLERPDRSRLALAMALDTVRAVLGPGPEPTNDGGPVTDRVAGVVIVTNDSLVRETLAALAADPEVGIESSTGSDPASGQGPLPERPGGDRSPRLMLVPDEPDLGLNAALVHGAALASARWPGRAVAALSADLPALRPQELRLALTAAADHPRAVLADATGTGTVLLTALTGHLLRPAFGSGSHAAHIRSGAADLTGVLGGSAPGLRRDVDTLVDLEQARILGVGAATAAVLASDTSTIRGGPAHPAAACGR